ncbi:MULTISPECIES: hypothetical protein [Staphylococcus]|uniref:hypothetical protein n=1 Tax=Staphylococcus TaxID=1279 RepID=UPI001642DCFB|nr:hypothetical protein [Staphylococcus saprophyticus]MDW3782131.1 hypothetical protein [Staphylococcus saprophyticus]MDW3787308.1 hypothetical protein [Staphylococcus saprophyticus]MDW3925716.1 hypothetical protein [Staphylococcus saprophyticus]MDW3933608.1 hypothetical protein [Staphylococcus saprophyticus]MDW3953119.1 hypothetical protein [Staphylococcus saprophyticus]
MRYDNRVIFAIEKEKVYNPKTSKTEQSMEVLEPIPCNFSPLSSQRTALEYGDVKKRMNVIRLNGNYNYPVTHAYIDNKKYLIVKPIYYRHDTVFYVEEVK